VHAYAIVAASLSPATSVHAFAPPELTTSAFAWPFSKAVWDQRTGAAEIRLVVNTPAASNRGPLLTTRTTSSPPESFRPAATPLAVNPAGCVILTGPPLG